MSSFDSYPINFPLFNLPLSVKTTWETNISFKITSKNIYATLKLFIHNFKIARKRHKKNFLPLKAQ